ncbi:MAG TPA: sialidase family protein [Gemmatimonadales bacterium]|nr:sialidase family protein [Gemmatimonadales bacterium]
MGRWDAGALGRWGIVVMVPFAVGCGGPKREDLAFTPTRVVSQETANGATPMFLVTPAGDRVLAWVAAEGGGSDGRLYLSVTPAGAPAALPTVMLTDPLGPIEPHGEAPPRLAADGQGGLYALYAVGKEVAGRRFPANALRLVRSRDHGRTWTRPVTVNGTGELGDFGSHGFHALTVAPDGAVLATWLENQGGKSKVVFARSTDGGASFGATRLIDQTEACPCCRTGVTATGDGRLFVSWRSVFPGDVRDVVVARSDDAGATWNAPVRPRNDGWVYPGCPHAGPAMALGSDGTVHIAWWTGKAGDAGVWYARSTDGGRSFVPTAIAVGASSRPAHVALALTPAGQVVLAWDDGLGAHPVVKLRRSPDGGRTWLAAQELSDPAAAGTFPVLALIGDSVAVAWSQQSTEAAEHAAHAMPDMKDPAARMPLPRVGQQEVYLRVAALR